MVAAVDSPSSLRKLSRTLPSAEAKKEMNGQEIDGCKVRVDDSITKRPDTTTPGIYKERLAIRRRRTNKITTPSRKSSKKKIGVKEVVVCKNMLICAVLNAHKKI